jgi:protein-tyrosine-phosphatase
MNVLFLCTGNSARSIMAEAILTRMGEGRFRAYSAGSHPRGDVHPQTIKLLKTRGHDVSGLRSKSWNEFTGPDGVAFDHIVTVCNNAANEVCPAIPGRPAKTHWDIPDPAAVDGNPRMVEAAFAKAYDMLAERIGAFVVAQGGPS